MKRAINSGLTRLGVVALALTAGTVQAEISSTVTAISDYDFRGITQTALDPAVQASLDWSAESGLYAGLWGSNVDFGTDQANVEADFFLGYGGAFTDTFAYDVGATYYSYYGEDSDVPSVNYWEFHGGLTYAEHYSTTFWYSPDYGNSDKTAWYLEANVDYPLPWWELGTTVHVGYSAGDYWSDADDEFDDEYFDWAVGLTRSFGHFDFALKYVDGSNLDDYDCSRSSIECGSDPLFSSQAKVVFGVSTTFPWKKDET